MEFNLAEVFDAVARGGARPGGAGAGATGASPTRSSPSASNRLANYLLEQGLGVAPRPRPSWPGHESGQDHLALYLHNGNEYLEGMLGGYRARVAPFNVNYRYVAEELRLPADRRAGHGDRLPRGVRRRPSPRCAAELPAPAACSSRSPTSRATSCSPGAVDYEESLAAASPEPPPVDARSPDDLYILYTGGTTGMPKGVLWRQHDIYVAAMGGRPFGTADALPVATTRSPRRRANGGGRACMPTPPFMHGAAQWAAFNAFTGGSTLVMPDDVERLDAADVLRSRPSAKGVSILLSSATRSAARWSTRSRPASYDLSSLLVGRQRRRRPERRRSRTGSSTRCPTHAAHGRGRLVGDRPADDPRLGRGPGGHHRRRSPPAPAPCVVERGPRPACSQPGDDELGWLAQRGRVPLGYLGDADKTARTFPVIDGVRYSVPGDRARSAPTACSSCWAATRSPSTPAARRSSPRRSSAPIGRTRPSTTWWWSAGRASAGATRSSPSSSCATARRPPTTSCSRSAQRAHRPLQAAQGDRLRRPRSCAPPPARPTTAGPRPEPKRPPPSRRPGAAVGRSLEQSTGGLGLGGVGHMPMEPGRSDGLTCVGAVEPGEDVRLGQLGRSRLVAPALAGGASPPAVARSPAR